MWLSCVVEGTRSKKEGRTLGASQLLSFPRQRTHVCQWHSPLCGPRRPSSAELATGSEAQQGVGILPKIQYPYFSPMNWPRLGLHCYLCIVLMAFLSSSLPSFLIPWQHQRNNRPGSNSIVWFQRHLFDETSLLSKSKPSDTYYYVSFMCIYYSTIIHACKIIMINTYLWAWHCYKHFMHLQNIKQIKIIIITKCETVSITSNMLFTRQSWILQSKHTVGSLGSHCGCEGLCDSSWLFYRIILPANLPPSSSDQLQPLAKDHHRWACWLLTFLPSGEGLGGSWDPNPSTQALLPIMCVQFCFSSRWPQRGARVYRLGRTGVGIRRMWPKGS